MIASLSRDPNEANGGVMNHDAPGNTEKVVDELDGNTIRDDTGLTQLDAANDLGFPWDAADI